jgi:hypothetical protein
MGVDIRQGILAGLQGIPHRFGIVDAIIGGQDE